MPTNDPEYMREYRATHDDYRTKSNQKNKARSRALSRLKEMYPTEFTKLYMEELRKVKAEDAKGS